MKKSAKELSEELEAAKAKYDALKKEKDVLKLSYRLDPQWKEYSARLFAYEKEIAAKIQPKLLELDAQLKAVAEEREKIYRELNSFAARLDEELAIKCVAAKKEIAEREDIDPNWLSFPDESELGND